MGGREKRMAKGKVSFYRKEVGRTETGEIVTVICRMDRGHCDFVYAEVTGDSLAVLRPASPMPATFNTCWEHP